MTRPNQSEADRSAAIPLPPSRTRWIEAREAAGPALVPLGPVRSRTPLERSEPPSPSRAGPGEAVPSPTGAWSPREALPDAMAGALDEFGSIPHLRAGAALDFGPADETVVVIEEAGAEPVSEPGEVTPDMHPVHAPLSPWELSGEPGGAVQAETPNERLARGQREWEAFGAAILAALDLDEDASLESAMQAMAKRFDLPEPPAPPGVPAEITHLADRIASFAFRLRENGYPVIAEAQAVGDRLEGALGGLAAAFLAGYER